MTDPVRGSRGGDADVRHGNGEPPRAGEEHLFAALDETRRVLGAAPDPQAPPDLTADILAAIAAERAAEPAPSPAPGRSRRRWLTVAAAGLTAAAAVLAVVVLGTGGAPTTPAPTPTAAPAAGTPVVLTSRDLPQALRSGLGGRDGAADPAARAACLVAHGLPAATVPLGSRTVVLDGRPGTLYVLGTGQAARFRLLVVGPACAPGSPDTLGDVMVGG
jgi:hypothetical protein